MFRGDRWMVILVVIFLSYQSKAQTIKGIVRQAGDGEILIGAIIKAVSHSGEVLKYGVSDQDGGFEMELPAGTDTLKISLLGYTEVIYVSPFQKEYDAQLRQNFRQIQEAVVTAAKVIVAGDTIRYNVNALKRKEDIVLSDVLSRIPGIEVDNLGFVKYNGLQINRFYVEGKDVLENNYNLATQNLAVEVIKDVEVLENHQPVKLLQGIRTSERAALNIILNENAKTKVNWGASGGLGVATEEPKLTASAKLSAFYVGKEFSSMNVGSFDNQGFALQEQDFALQTGRPYGHLSITRFLDNSISKAPLSDRRSLFNQSWEAVTVDQVPLSETSTLGVTFKYGADKRESASQQRTVYQSPDVLQNQILARDEKRTEDEYGLSALLSFQNNGKKLYLTNQLYVDWVFSGSITDVSGGIKQLQNTGGHQWNVDNEASASFKTGERLLSIKSFTQFSGMREFLSLDTDAVHQDVGVSFFCQSLSVSGISRSKGDWRFSLQPQIDFLLFNRTSSLEGFESPLSAAKGGTNRVYLLKGGLEGSANYRKSPIEVAFSATVKGGRYKIDDQTETMPLGEFSSYLKYLTGRWDCTARLSAGLREADFQELSGPLILTSYYTLWKGRKNAMVSPFGQASLEGRFREPVSGWNCRISSVLGWSKTFLQARELLDPYVLEYQTEDAVFPFSVTSIMEISKGLFSINGNISLSLVHAYMSGDLEQNGVNISYYSHSFTPVIKVNAALTRWWGLSCEANLNAYKYITAEVVSYWKMNSRLMLNQSFHLSSFLMAGVSIDYYYHAVVGQPVIFPSLSLIWKAKDGLRVKIEADNLADVRTYSWQSESPLLTQNYQIKIRPLTVLAGLEWRF